MDEEVVLLEEQLAAAHADIERLQSQLDRTGSDDTKRDADLKDAQRELEVLRTDLALRDAALQARDGETEALQSQLEAAATQSRLAAARYRDVLLAHEPDLPAELVTGETVADIDAALAQARQTVAQVRQHLEQQAQAMRIPSGAPVRTPPDLSALSAGEKIRLGMQQS